MKQTGPYVTEHALEKIGFVRPVVIYDWIKSTTLSKVAKISFPDKQKKIGEGSRGFVWELNGNKALKVTDDWGEALAAAAISKKEHKGLYKTYGVWKSKHKAIEFQNEILNLDGVYFIVMDKLKSNPARQKDAGSAWMVGNWNPGWFPLGFQEYMEMSGETVDPNEIRNSAFWSLDKIRMAKDFLETTDLTNKKQLKEDILNICYGLLNLKFLNIKFQDVHGKNMMVNSKNEMVLIDLGWSLGAKGDIQSF